MHTILLAGASGFVGSHLHAELVKSNKNIYVLEKKKIYTYKNIYTLLSKQQFDVIYYCAGVSGPNNCQQYSGKSFYVNVQLPFFLLEAVKELKKKTKLVMLGSCLEYGVPQYLPLNEQHPVVPIDMYGMQKSYISQCAIMLARRFGLDIVVLRTTNIYGNDSRQSTYLGHSAMNHFIQRARRGETLTIYGDGSQLRDYLYIDDFIRLLFLIGNKNEGESGIYNVGSGNPISFLQMCKQIASMCHVDITFAKYPKDLEMYERGDVYTSIDLVRKEFSWSPTISIEEGLRRSIADNEFS